MTSPTSKRSDPFGNPNPWAEPSWYNSLHSPYYSTSHRRLRSYVRDYINTRVLPYAPEWEASGEVPQSERIKYAASGLAFADVPAEYRPKGFEKIGDTDVKVEELDAFHTLLMADETSRVEGGVMVGLEGASVIGAPPSEHPHPSHDQSNNMSRLTPPQSSTTALRPKKPASSPHSLQPTLPSASASPSPPPAATSPPSPPPPPSPPTNPTTPSPAARNGSPAPRGPRT